MALVLGPGPHYPFGFQFSQFWKNRRAKKAVRLMEQARVAEQRARLREECLAQIQSDQIRYERQSAEYENRGLEVPSCLSGFISLNQDRRISTREYFA